MHNPETDGEQAAVEITPLADGTEVPNALLGWIRVGLKSALGEYGSFAAHDLRRMAEGQQPELSPLGDIRPVYVSAGLCEMDEEGMVSMHQATADVVRNSVFIDPDNISKWVLVDPTQPFTGFDIPQN